jgi:hypothetical protein
MTDYRSQQRPTRRSAWAVFVLPLLAFLLGLAAMGWALSRWDTAATYLGISPAPVQPVPAPSAPTQAPSPLPAAAPAGATQTLLIDPETQRRVAQLEERVNQVALQTRAAAGNADRAEGLLVAFAARRALDRGVALGYIEGLLRQRFGETQRAAVATIITAAREPVTLEDLQTGLQAAAPALTGGGESQSWWRALRAEFGSIVTVRKAGTPSTVPDERFRRATQRLESGQVDVALAEVLRLPGRDGAATWIAAARRYVSARQALDTIETAALLDPGPAAVRPVSPSPAQ